MSDHSKILPKVVHCKNSNYDIYIGRPSKWGNPFSHKQGTLVQFKVNNRTEAIEAYRSWIINQPELMSSLSELFGKTLGCWCKPHSCHGDVLVDLISGVSSTKRGEIKEAAIKIMKAHCHTLKKLKESGD